MQIKIQWVGLNSACSTCDTTKYVLHSLVFSMIILVWPKHGSSGVWFPAALYQRQKKMSLATSQLDPQQYRGQKYGSFF